MKKAALTERQIKYATRQREKGRTLKAIVRELEVTPRYVGRLRRVRKDRHGARAKESRQARIAAALKRQGRGGASTARRAGHRRGAHDQREPLPAQDPIGRDAGCKLL